MMTRHLLWKDSMTIKPLVSAILIGIVAIYVMLALVASSLDNEDTTSIFVSFWVLMPNLIALGAPALLVGSEEESGTLGWLRTLPVQWQKVADSKFAVAMGALAITWIACSLLMVVARSTVAAHSTPYAVAMLETSAVAYLLFFSVLLMTCGFITAYLFRSPVAGLIAVVPLIAIVNLVVSEVGRWILTGDIRYKGMIDHVSVSAYFAVVVAGVALLALAWGIQRLVARRRLTSPQAEPLKYFAPSGLVSGYRPPMIVANTSRPTQTSALLWQQVRQMGMPGAALMCIIAAFMVSYVAQYFSRSRGWVAYVADMSPLVIAIGSSWLGGLAFFGDNVRRRCAFFADRGVQPTKIWWTRLVLPAVFVSVPVAVAMLLRFNEVEYVNQRIGSMVVIMIVSFAFGQLVGQWMRRPILTFFAAPAYAAIASIFLFWLSNLYPTFYWMSAFVAPVLVFASWRLSGRWLSERIDFGYHWRVRLYGIGHRYSDRRCSGHAMVDHACDHAIVAGKCVFDFHARAQHLCQWSADPLAGNHAGFLRQWNVTRVSEDDRRRTQSSSAAGIGCGADW